jgi:hypothetical protein
MYVKQSCNRSIRGVGFDDIISQLLRIVEELILFVVRI